MGDGTKEVRAVVVGCFEISVVFILAEMTRRFDGLEARMDPARVARAKARAWEVRRRDGCGGGTGVAAEHVFIGCVRTRGLPGRAAWARVFNAFAGADGPVFRQVGVAGVRRSVKTGVLGQARFFPRAGEAGLRVRVAREDDLRLRLWTRTDGAWSLGGQGSESKNTEVWELPAGRLVIDLPSVWTWSGDIHLPFWELRRENGVITATLDAREPERGEKLVRTMEYVGARAPANAVAGRADVISTDPIVTTPQGFWDGVADGGLLRRLVDALLVCQRIRIDRDWGRA